MPMEKNKVSRVCVTGGSGYIGCWLVKKLLENGHTVHATVRNLGCQFVFHVATPTEHNPESSRYKDIGEAAVAGVRSIADSCIRSQTVKRLIYTASILSMSPRREDGVGFKACLDESCWTPLDASYTYGNAFTVGYLKSKILAEKAVLSYNDFDDGKLEVLTLPCGLVGGETLLSYLPISVGAVLSQLTGDLFSGNSLKLLQECIGSVPIAHVNDVCQAHIFCMEQLSMRGRFCCAVSGLSVKEMAMYFQKTYPEYNGAKKLTQGQQVGSKGDFSKLMKIGFEYKYGIKDILDDSVAWAKKLNGSSLSQVV